MDHEIQRWVDFAQSDLAVAKHLMEAFHPTPHEIICYHCQQAAEKMIKAVYLRLALPGGLPRKHDLTFLLEQMKHRVDVPESLFDHCDRLNSYGVVVRYPAKSSLIGPGWSRRFNMRRKSWHGEAKRLGLCHKDRSIG